MAAIIVEGLTGFVKTSTIAALRAQRPATILFDESLVFDEYVVANRIAPSDALRHATARLDGVLDAAERSMRGASTDVLIERFHLSHAAVDGDWSAYDALDERAARLGARLVLLDLADERIAARSLYRAEYGGADWQHMLDGYGSEAAALAALRRSQRRRRRALARTRLATLVIDTAAMDWPSYATAIWRWAT